MSLLHAGDHITDSLTGTDLTVVDITDHTADGIGHEVIEAVDATDHLWFVLDGGDPVRGGVR